MASKPKPERSVEVFLSYAREDNDLRYQLEKQLSILKRKGLITTWYDQEIDSGDNRLYEINRHLNTAQIILLLVSSDFMASDYCYSSEMTRALERHRKGEARVIPIILRPIDWRDTPLDKLQALPRNAKPISSWSNKDEAFFNVAQGIRKVVEDLLKTHMHTSVDDLLVDLTQASPQPPVWNIPYRHNPFFTGREDILSRLYELLIKNRANTVESSNLHVLHGLGGVGKTQIAIEYAYRYSRNYQTILWARADSRLELISDFVSIANWLNLPEKNVQDQNLTVTAVQKWMESNTDWLLILDNADNLGMITDFIPFGNKGHILLTTRSKNLGNVQQRIRVDKMNINEAALLLLRRAKLIENDASIADASDPDRILAIKLAETLEGFALAIELAGIYIEKTQSSLFDYLQLYLSHRPKILEEKHKATSEYLETAVAWSLVFEEIKETQPFAIEPLYLSAFLYPNTIPQEVISNEFPNLHWSFRSTTSTPNRLQNTLEELTKSLFIDPFSETQTFSLHPLIQALLKGSIQENKQRHYAEQVVRAVNQVFPLVEPSTWYLCQRYLPQAQLSAAYIKQWNMESLEAVQLLRKVAHYLKDRGHYSMAELLATQTLEIQEKTLGLNHLEVAQILNDLAEIYRAQGKYIQAESVYQRSLTILKRTLGPNAAEVAQILNNLATIFNDQGMYIDAEIYFRQALNIRRQILGPSHPDVAQSLNNLALLYSAQGKYDEAEHLFIQALDIRKSALGPVHPDIATSLNNLATVYSDRGRYALAKELFDQALAIDKKFYGENHPNVARDFNNLGGVLETQGDLLSAQALYERALYIDQSAYGSDHPNVAGDINNLGGILRKMGNLIEAQALYERALYIDQSAYGSDHPNVAIRLNNLGSVLQEQGLLTEAQTLYERAFAIVETSQGQISPKASSILNNLASVYKAQKDLPKAQVLYEKALTAAQATYGPNHLNVGNIVNNLGNVLEEMGDVASARVYYKQALQIFLEHLGENHPDVTRIEKILDKITGEQNDALF